MKNNFHLKLGRDDILKLAAQYKADVKGMEIEERALEVRKKERHQPNRHPLGQQLDKSTKTVLRVKRTVKRT